MNPYFLSIKKEVTVVQLTYRVFGLKKICV